MKKRDSIKVKRKGKTIEVEVEYRHIPKKERKAYKQRMQDRMSKVHNLKIVFG